MSKNQSAETATEKDGETLQGSEAPLLEHLIELRNRLLWIIGVFVVALSGCLFFAGDIFAILLWPYEQAAGPTGSLELIYTAPHEFFFTQIKLSMFAALFLCFPYIAFQLYRFVAPGLYKNERSAFLPFLVASPLLFAAGAALVFFIIMPLAFEFFMGMQLEQNEGADIRMVNRVSEYLSFTMLLMMAFGLCFQLPVLLTLMGKAGLVSAEGLGNVRKYAIIGILVLAAIVTPPDVITQVILFVVVYGLYEISIFLVRRVETKR